jgi:hypothetical protein
MWEVSEKLNIYLLATKKNFILLLVSIWHYCIYEFEFQHVMRMAVVYAYLMALSAAETIWRQVIG